jgi:hypothetical protein
VVAAPNVFILKVNVPDVLMPFDFVTDPASTGSVKKEPREWELIASV